MIDPDRNIYTNALPSSNIPPFAIPNPLLKVRDAAIRANQARKIKTAKGEFGLAGDKVSFSFRDTPAISRLRIEVVHPQDVYINPDGSAVPASKNADELLSGPDSSRDVVRARGVEVFKGVFSRDGFFISAPRIEHHVLSTMFEGNFVKDRKKGVEAGKAHAADILEGLEAHGIEFLESIEDPELREDAAKAMWSARDLLGNPQMHFGRDAISPDSSPDAVTRSAEFKGYLMALLGVKPIERPATGIQLG